MATTFSSSYESSPYETSTFFLEAFRVMVFSFLTGGKDSSYV
jgi:hypothetical protein